jgi:hypothetical protein
MEAKDKAKELVEKYLKKIIELAYAETKTKELAKKCALICVEELIKFAYDLEWKKKEEALVKIKFLKEVKQEINNL